jgi:hypothetical protein
MAFDQKPPPAPPLKPSPTKPMIDEEPMVNGRHADEGQDAAHMLRILLQRDLDQQSLAQVLQLLAVIAPDTFGEGGQDQDPEEDDPDGPQGTFSLEDIANTRDPQAGGVDGRRMGADAAMRRRVANAMTRAERDLRRDFPEFGRLKTCW